MRPLLTLLLCMLAGAARPQQAFLQADTLVMRIGEHTGLSLGITLPGGESAVEWPALGDTLAPHVELLRQEPVDTLAAADGTVQLVQRLFVTSFDTGFWAIPPMKFTLNGATLETAPLLIEVRGVQVDPSGTIRDISPLYEPPFDLLWWLRKHWLWFAAGAVLLMAVVMLVRKWRRRPVSEPATVPVIIGPVHERFLKQLEEVEGQRLWQNGEHKTFHSRITDIVRGYLEERFKVPALERTTDDLLLELRTSAIAPDLQQRLANMLRLADLVKFAKAVPSATENERMLAGAREFIKATIPTNTESHG
jgi:hypothetical protein